MGLARYAALRKKDCDVDEHNRLYVYGVMARLSLAAALELEKTAPKA